MEFDIIQEEVPPFIRRLGDQTFQGSNNSLIVLGTDRAAPGPATIDSGLGRPGASDKGRGSGAIHMIVGRKDLDGNPDFDKDSSYLYLSMRTDVDGNLGSTFEGSDSSVSAVVAKGDAIRIDGRKNVKIFIDGGKCYIHLDEDQCIVKVGSSTFKMKSDKITVDSKTIELGPDAVERLMLGDSFMKLYNNHLHVSPTGPTSPPTVPMTDSQLSSQVSKTR